MSLLKYTQQGIGKTIVFLHGFLEDKSMWNDYVDELKNNFQIVCIDLPGHGESPTYNVIHSMSFMAKKVAEVLDFLKISKAIFVGHSMGGYVIMNLLENFSSYFESYILFFSSPFEDDDEKKNVRMRAVEVVKKDKESFINLGIPNLFNQNNLDKLQSEILYAKNIAKNTSIEGIVAALLGMKERKDSTELFNYSSIPSLIISGNYDNAVSVEKLKSQLIFDSIRKHKVLNVGHMGHLEAKSECLELIKEFVNY